MPEGLTWDVIAGWVMLLGILLAVLWGRKAAKGKAARLQASAYAQAMRDLKVTNVQHVAVAGDDRRSVALGAVGHHPADIPAHISATYHGAAVDAAARAQLGAGSGVAGAYGGVPAVPAGGDLDGDAGHGDVEALIAAPWEWDEDDARFVHRSAEGPASWGVE